MLILKFLWVQKDKIMISLNMDCEMGSEMETKSENDKKIVNMFWLDTQSWLSSFLVLSSK